MGIIELITAIAEAFKSAMNLGTTLADSEKVKDEKFEIHKITYEANEINRMTDEFFGDLKEHTELTVEDKVNLECPKMNEEQKKLFILILNDRIIQYRKANAWARPKFKKWLKENNIKLK